jgi:hypothetical protein
MPPHGLGALLLQRNGAVFAAPFSIISTYQTLFLLGLSPKAFSTWVDTSFRRLRPVGWSDLARDADKTNHFMGFEPHCSNTMIELVRDPGPFVRTPGSFGLELHESLQVHAPSPFSPKGEGQGL